MKSIFLKILASASLLLGLLGPQVASGSNLSSVQPEPEPSSIEVVSSTSSANIVVTEANTASICGFSGLSLERIDWLIWQACDSIEVKTQVQTQSLQVVTAPSDVPSVKVVSSETQDLYTPYDLAPIQTTQNLPAIPMSAVVVSTRLKIVGEQKMGGQRSSSYGYTADRQNIFTTISMRC